MRLALFVPLALLAATPALAQTSRDYPVDGFRAVELRGPQRVTVRVGGAFAVRASGTAAALADLDIRRDGDRLVIRRTRQGWLDKRDIAQVEVTLPAIERASVSGSGDMNVDRVNTPRFAAAVAGSGDLRIGSLATRDAALSVSGSGDLWVSGRADAAQMSVTGSGDLHGDQLTLTRAQASVTGSGDLRAQVHGNAQVSLIGSGDIDLGAGARCTISKMGSGSVRCG
ncbi:MAG: hypothetical protein A4S16_08865 [Proteobacteria bacterium SG_bin6]|nr:MAG: hypothetical protein A4S16_08865 [Proteobacteria bacterium SG_bin6]